MRRLVHTLVFHPQVLRAAAEAHPEVARETPRIASRANLRFERMSAQDGWELLPPDLRQAARTWRDALQQVASDLAPRS